MSDVQCQINLVSSSALIQAVKKTGLLMSDPRLRDCVYQMKQSSKESVGPVLMDKKLFRRCCYFCILATYLVLQSESGQINFCTVSS